MLSVGFIFINQSIMGQTSELSEAPHIFYENDKVIVKQIKNGNLINTEINNRKDFEVTVNVSSSSSFSFKLKERLLNEPAISKGASKMLFLSDVEGTFQGFKSLLIAQNVIDESYNWTYGAGKLVICGDLFDRGKQVTEVLWLLYKLETEAVKHGGYVHTILGNHDIMNLSGDLRYVDARYMEISKAMGHEYGDLFSTNTELGRWLRNKNVIEKIGDNLCAHAGISSAVNDVGMPLQQINDSCRPFYDKAMYLDQLGERNPGIAAFYGSKTSLFWYRGYFTEPKIKEEEVDKTLRLYDVKRIVVGHTIRDTNIGFYYNGKVLGVDVNHHAGIHQAALYLDGNWYKVDNKGMKVALMP